MIQRYLVEAPRILCVLAIVWLSMVAIAFSDAGVPFPTWMLVSFFGVGLAGCWILCFSVWLYGHRKRKEVIRQNRRLWLITAGLMAAGFVLANTESLLSTRVYLSAAALRETAATLSKIPQIELRQQGRWVGLFHVREFSQFGSELRFITNECGLVDTCGIVFSPDGPPPNRDEDSFSHLYGPWWHWYQSW